MKSEMTRMKFRLIELNNTNRYHLVAAEMLGTPFIMNIVEAIINADIIVGNSSGWSVLPVGPVERMCSSFKGFSVLMYECLFTKLGVRLFFSEFEVVVLNRPRVAPLQHHPRAWAYMKVFQLYAKSKSWKPSLELFFYLFYATLTS